MGGIVKGKPITEFNVQSLMFKVRKRIVTLNLEH
jgi:hypothetical protein